MKLDLYTKASKCYLNAAGLIVGDRSTVTALIFLSQSALFKAELAHSMIQTVASASSLDMQVTRSTITLDKEKTARKENNFDEQIGQASLSGRILLMSNSSHDRGSGLSSSKMRASGLMSVPKAGTILPSDAAYDLFFLEKKLSELGLMSGCSGNTGRNNSALTSALGESFMLLSTSSSKRLNRPQFLQNPTTIPFSARDSVKISKQEERLRSGDLNSKNGIRYPIGKVEIPNDLSTAPLSFAGTSTITGPYGGIKKPTISNTDQQKTLSNGLNGTKNGKYWLPNPIDILNWRGAKSSLPPSTSTSTSDTPKNISKEDVLSESCQFDLNWNDDLSVFNTLPNNPNNNADCIKSNKSRNGDQICDNNNNINNIVNNINNNVGDDSDCSISQIISPSSIQSYFNSSHSQSQQLLSAMNDDINNNNNSNNNDNNLRESELRLLQSIKILGDENSALLHRIDILSTVETKNLELRKEMVSFKKEFQERFLRLKEVLREFQRKNSKDGNLRTFGFEFSTVIGSSAGEGGRLEKVKDENVSTVNGACTGAEADVGKIGTNPDDQENVRQQQLERTVLALIKRLEEVRT